MKFFINIENPDALETGILSVNYLQYEILSKYFKFIVKFKIKIKLFSGGRALQLQRLWV